jgi:hypothetical protein
MEAAEGVAREAALRAATAERSEKSVGTMIFRIEFNMILSSPGGRTLYRDANTRLALDLQKQSLCRGFNDSLAYQSTRAKLALGDCGKSTQLDTSMHEGSIGNSLDVS